jgi:hypothetical protein
LPPDPAMRSAKYPYGSQREPESGHPRQTVGHADCWLTSTRRATPSLL